MNIGVPREIKDQEHRVSLTPDGVGEVVRNGHTVFVQHDAGAKIGFDDAHYQAAGATVLDSAEEIFRTAEMIVKVKEPQPNECAWLRDDQVLFTYLHLAADKALTQRLLASGVTGIAYETVSDPAGRLPLLIPMSEVAGRLSVQAGATSLEIAHGGNGTLLGGVPGVPAAEVLIIGGGIAGTQAAHMAAGLGASVTVLDRSLPRLAELDEFFGGRVATIYSTAGAIAERLPAADLVIGAVLIPGRSAPKLVSRAALAGMKRGAVLVDIAIDQGGCFETSHPTTHTAPTFVVDDVVHYCVANMPGAVARTSTFALTHATLPYVHRLAAAGGWRRALAGDPHFSAGLNVTAGQITHQGVAESLGLPFTPP